MTPTDHPSSPGCARAIDQMADMLAGDAPPSDRAAFVSHLASCEACRLEFESLAGTSQAVTLAAGSRADAHAATSGLTLPRLHSAGRAERAPGHRRVLTWCAIAAAFAAGFFLHASPTIPKSSGPSGGQSASVIERYAASAAASPHVSDLERGLLSIARH